MSVGDIVYLVTSDLQDTRLRGLSENENGVMAG